MSEKQMRGPRDRFRRILLALLLLSAFAAGGCARRTPAGASVPQAASPAYQTGHASWYGKRFHGRKTANGERFDMHALTAAHRELPFGTIVRVVHRETRREVVVRINDRGPWVGGRIIDLSHAAARRLGMIEEGVAPVSLYLD